MNFNLFHDFVNTGLILPWFRVVDWKAFRSSCLHLIMCLWRRTAVCLFVCEDLIKIFCDYKWVLWYFCPSKMLLNVKHVLQIIYIIFKIFWWNTPFQYFSKYVLVSDKGLVFIIKLLIWHWRKQLNGGRLLWFISQSKNIACFCAISS